KISVGGFMKVKICLGARCTMLGADVILDSIEDIKENITKYKSKEEVKVEDIDIEIVNCFGYCKKDKKLSPVVEVDDKVFTNAKSEILMEYILDRAFEKNFEE